MKTNTNTNIAAVVALLSRYNWLTVTAEAEGKEPQTFHATGINTHMGDFLAFDRQCATGFYTDNAVVDITAAGENTFTFLTASGTAYTVTGENKAGLAHRDTAAGSLGDPASLIDWHRSGLTEAGEVLVVLDFRKAGQISGKDSGKIKSFVNSNLDGKPQSRQHCRTIYIKAASDKTDYFDPVVIGLYSLESETVLTGKTFYFDVSFSETESDTIRAMLKAAKVIETRTNEIGKDGCYIFTVETFGSLKPDEETEEDNTKENRKRSQIMKTQNLKVHGIYHMFNVGGIEVHIEEGYDPLVYWRYSIIDEKPQKWYKAKVTYTAAGRSYFQANGKRIYLDQVMSV